MAEHSASMRGGGLRVPRSRGAVGGLLLIVLGVWGAIVPFIGPLFDFGYTPSDSWTWTAARGWLEVAPGAAVVLGGLVLLVSANRVTTSLGGWLGVAGGAWFVVGPELADVLHVGSIGSPAGTSASVRALETLFLFTALGAAIVLVAGMALGRLSVRSVRDVRAAERRAAAETVPSEAVPAAETVPAATAPAASQPVDARSTDLHGQNDHVHRHFGRRRHAAENGADTAAPVESPAGSGPATAEDPTVEPGGAHRS